MRKVDYRPAEFHEKGKDRVMIELARQYPPTSVIREYCTNALDARLPGVSEDISVLVLNPKDNSMRRIVITDNGKGMTPEKLESLRHSIGYSEEKAGRIDMRGEKGLGILAFASAGEQVIVLSRPHGADSGFGYLSFENKKDRRIMSGFTEIDADEVDNMFYGFFPHGTRVIIDRVGQNFMDKIYTVANMKNMLSRLYTPALRKGDVNMRVGKMGKRIKTEEVIPIEFQGDLLLETEMQLQDKDTPLTLEAFLLFNAESVNDKPMIYSKDVLVYSAITELPEFAKSRFWGCGKLTGYINDQFSKLILGRDGIDRQRRQFGIWADCMRQIEGQFGKTIADRVKKGPKEKENSLFREAWRALAEARKSLSQAFPSQLYIRAGVSGEERIVRGVPPEGEPQRGSRGPRKPRGPRGEGEGRGTGGTFEIAKEGEVEKVVPKKKVSLGFPTPTIFPEQEAHLRSKLEERLGAPMIYVNTGHQDYKRRIRNYDDLLKYVIDLCAKEIAAVEVGLNVEQRIVTAEEAAPQALSRAEDMKYQAFEVLM